MKKLASQITVALVCCVLGFMIATQFRMLSKQDKGINVNRNSAEITVENEQLKKVKEEADKQVNELQRKLKEYEDAAANKGDVNKSLVKDVETYRMLLGGVDVQGEGIVVYLNPKNNVFTSNAPNQTIMDRDLVNIVNELHFAGAEAVSINDIRVTAMTGIRNASNYILINEEKVSPSKRITIKAIGNKNLLYSALSFPGVFSEIDAFCEIKYDKVDSIKIGKYNKTYKLEYAKPVKS